MIYRVKCLDIVTLTVLPTICLQYNSKGKSKKFPIPKMKLGRFNTINFPWASSMIKCLEDFEKIAGF